MRVAPLVPGVEEAAGIGHAEQVRPGLAGQPLQFGPRDSHFRSLLMTLANMGDVNGPMGQLPVMRSLTRSVVQ